MQPQRPVPIHAGECDRECRERKFGSDGRGQPVRKDDREDHGTGKERDAQVSDWDDECRPRDILLFCHVGTVREEDSFPDREREERLPERGDPDLRVEKNREVLGE